MSDVSPGHFASLACLWEATARKAGNVHPGRDFPDLRYDDFLLSAGAIAPTLDRARDQAVGQTVLQAIQATRRVVSTNTNLGIVLLLAPLAAVRADDDLQSGLEAILQALTVADSRDVYAAIRLAIPGSLGEVADEDVRRQPSLPLRQVMALAQERDMIARQYANGFREIFVEGVPTLQSGLDRFGNMEDTIVFSHLSFMARHSDTLIARKRGLDEASEASGRAQSVLDAGWPETAKGQKLFEGFDAWLSEIGHQRNPGTSADLVTASLFVLLRQNIMKITPQVPWSRPS